MLNIRTCSDSGRALLQLLTYYINDGDLNPEPQPGDSTNSSPKRAMEEELLSMEQQITLSQSQQDQVSELLEEAMKESPKSSTQCTIDIYILFKQILYFCPL